MTTWAVFGLAIAILCVALWFLLKRNTGVHRKTLPRIFELYDLITTPRPPSAYFQNFEQSLLEIPQKLKQFRDIERDLQGLDADGWAFLKSEVAPLLVARDPKRGWQALFDKLNQAKAFNHLKEAGYQNIRFVPPSAVRGQQTPDLQADGALCEVKTINISEVEADRRDGGGASEPVQIVWTKASSGNSHLIFAKREIRWRHMVQAGAQNILHTSSSISTTACTNMPTGTGDRSTNSLQAIRCQG